DAIGRAIGVTAPAATSGATRQQQTFSYSGFNTGGWTAPQLINNDGNLGNPVLVNYGPNQYMLFVRNAANNVQYKTYKDGAWGNWQNLGGCVTGDPAA